MWFPAVLGAKLLRIKVFKIRSVILRYLPRIGRFKSAADAANEGAKREKKRELI
jgi:hypothetical protein